MINKYENLKGYLKINDIEYIFSLEGKYLYLFNKKNDLNIIYSNNEETIKKIFLPHGAWLAAYGETGAIKYYFYCSNPVFQSNQNFSLMVDYYAEIFSEQVISDFEHQIADGFLFTADFIGEYIKDCIEEQHYANNESLILSFPRKKIKLTDKNIEFIFCHEVIGNITYYGLSAIKPIMMVVSPQTTINTLIDVFGCIIRTFSFIFRKNIITVPYITVLQKLQNERLAHSYNIYFTNCEPNDVRYNRVISSKALPYFDKLYQLVENKELNTYHIPKSRTFEVTHLILMYSWFEKLYKTLPCNALVELKKNKKGKSQLYWKSGHPDPKKSGNLIADKDQLYLVLQDNPSLKDYALKLLMKTSGWLQINQFIGGFPERVSNYRNDIIHNEDILWYPFIFQDTCFLELINYYLIMRYKCQCPYDDLDQLIRGWFLDL